MDMVASKVGGYWLGQQATGQLNSVGDDINSLTNNIEGGTKWLVNKIKGKMQKPLVELLQEYDLPKGLFPRDATNYEFNEETKKLVVSVPSVCEVLYKDGSIVRFSTTITATMEKGKLVDVQGIKTKFIIWIKVSGISAEESKVNFTAGITRTRERKVYEIVRDGLIVDKF